MTRALVVDVSLAPVQATGPTVLAAPTFPGAAGAAWPAADWTTSVGDPAGSVTQDGAGYGQLQANNATAWNSSSPTAVHKTVSSVNLELTGRFLTPGTNGYVPQFWPGVGIGVGQSSTVDPGSGAFTQGFTLLFALGNAVWTLIGPDGNNLTGEVSQPWTQQTLYGYRLRRTVANGIATASARVWPYASAEPTAWGATGTSTLAAALPAGTIAFHTGQGGDNELRPIKHTGLQVTNAG